MMKRVLISLLLLWPGFAAAQDEPLATPPGFGEPEKPPAPPAAISGIATESEDYPPGLVKDHIRICPGTVWPARTERLVMPLMAANARKFQGKKVLDIGTGSGILALYAAQLGAAKVVATDIEPRAIDCTNENARRLGYEKIIETRLVSLKDTSAFAVCPPGETFDIIVSYPYCVVNRIPGVVDGALDEGIQPDDNIRFGLTILNGLRNRLNDDGVAILGYRFAVAHSLMVNYARHLGFAVDHHPALQIAAPDWYALYNTFAAGVAKTEKIDPRALIFPKMEIGPGSYGGYGDPGDPGGPGSGVFIRVDYAARTGLLFPRLWDSQIDRVLPGMMVIRKRPGTR